VTAPEEVSAARQRRIEQAVNSALAARGRRRGRPGELTADDYLAAIAAGLDAVVREVGTRPPVPPVQPVPAVPVVPEFRPSPGSVWLGLPGGRAIRVDDGDDDRLRAALPTAREAFDALDRLDVARERILGQHLTRTPRPAAPDSRAAQ
jgi:hypothetical protein